MFNINFLKNYFININLKDIDTKYGGFFKGSIIKCLGLLSTFFLNFLVIARLGADKSGIFLVCMNISFLLTTVTQSGFNRSLVKFIAQLRVINNYKSINKVINLSLKFSLIFSILLFSILVLFAPTINKIVLNENDIRFILIIFSISIPFTTLINSNSYVIQGFGHTTKSIFFRLLLVPTFTLILVLILAVNDLIYFASIYVFSSMVVSLLSEISKNIIKNKEFSTNENSFSEEIFNQKEFIQKSFYSWQVTTLSIFTIRIIELMVGIYCNSFEVTLFSTSLRIAMLTRLSTVGVNQSIPANIAALYKQKNYEKIKSISSQSIKFMKFLSLPLFICILFAPNLMLGFFSDELVGQPNTLRILCLGTMTSVFAGPNETILSMCNHENFLLKTFFISFFIGFATSILLIPFMGISGAAIGLSFGLISKDIICKYKFNKLFYV